MSALKSEFIFPLNFLSKILNRAPKLTAKFGGAAMALTMQLMVRASNRWRDSYNPLRGLTITRIVELLEQGQCGCFGELQWLYFFIERRDATLRAVIARRRAALLKLDWEIKTVAELPEGATESQAAEIGRAHV
mgnify:CR=1 FL=1